jgi:type IV pilus assembly protein PilV
MRTNLKSKIQNPKLILNSRRDGLTLIEVLIALTILSLGLLGVALMQVSSISGNTFSREMGVATTLAQDLIEKLRTMEYSDTNTDTALIAGNHPTADDVAANLAPAVFGDANNIIDERGLWPARATALGTTAGPLIYTRTWTVTDNSPATDMKSISVTVSWTEKGATPTTRSITLNTIKVKS